MAARAAAAAWRSPHLAGGNAGLAAGLVLGIVGGLPSPWTAALAVVSALAGGIAFAAATLARRGLGIWHALAAATERPGLLPLVPPIAAAVASVAWLAAATAVSALPLALVVGTVVSRVVARALRRRGRDPVAAADLDQVCYRGEVVAVAGTERVWYMPQIEVLETDHPRRRFVAALCLTAAHCRSGVLPRPDDEAGLERLARELLIPPEKVGDDPDAMVAERLNVPLDQVTARRRDLGRAPVRG